MSVLLSIVAVVLVTLYTVAIMDGGILMIASFIDIPSLLIIVLWTVPVLVGAGMIRDFFASFKRMFSKTVCTREDLSRSMESVQLAQKANWTGGILGFVMAFVYICQRYADIGAELFMCNLAVAVIILVYAALLNLLLLMVYGRLKKRYMDYMYE